MARTRRQKLARTLTESTDLSYQQALVWLDGYVAAAGRLPRSDAELNAARSGTAAPVETHPGAAGVSALVRVDDVTAVRMFTMNYSSLSSCPGLVMSVPHWLPSGVCAHSEPECPTCRGVGQLAAGDRTVECGLGAGLPTGVPVCEGSGVWTGQRT